MSGERDDEVCCDCCRLDFLGSCLVANGLPETGQDLPPRAAPDFRVSVAKARRHGTARE
jgi:hypothetical protein